ncbi:MAG: hypothetical protein ACTH7L_01870 [Psychrobacter alimentarius]
MTTELNKEPISNPTSIKKPPTQIAGVTGIDAHGSMGEAPVINWHHLIRLPSFEMFVLEESGQHVGSAAVEWINSRRQTMGDDKLYDLYASWHKKKGLWPDETPTGELVNKD